MKPSHDHSTAALDALEIPLSASESHGLLCGLVCSGSVSAAKSRWFGELLDTRRSSDAPLESRTRELRQLEQWFSTTLDALNDADLAFEPLLPDDQSSTLAQRVDALGEFCAGFSYGLGIGIGKRASNEPLPEDIREVLSDFQSIDSADTRDLDGDDEADFTELLEFVRVGVLLVHEELKPVSAIGTPDADRFSRSLH